MWGGCDVVQWDRGRLQLEPQLTFVFVSALQMPPGVQMIPMGAPPQGATYGHPHQQQGFGGYPPQGPPPGYGGGYPQQAPPPGYAGPPPQGKWGFSECDTKFENDA